MEQAPSLVRVDPFVGPRNVETIQSFGFGWDFVFVYLLCAPGNYTRPRLRCPDRNKSASQLWAGGRNPNGIHRSDSRKASGFSRKGVRVDTRSAISQFAFVRTLHRLKAGLHAIAFTPSIEPSPGRAVVEPGLQSGPRTFGEAWAYSFAAHTSPEIAPRSIALPRAL